MVKWQSARSMNYSNNDSDNRHVFPLGVGIVESFSTRAVLGEVSAHAPLAACTSQAS